MQRRKLKCKFFAFVPFVNSSYCVGLINDSINKNYFHETFARFNLLILKIIRSILLFFLVYIFLFYSTETKEVFLNILFARGNTLIDFLKVCNGVDLIRNILIFSLVFSVVFLVYLFKVYSNIFNEYCGEWNKLALVFSVLAHVFLKLFFVADLFLYIFREKTSKFEFLNKANRFI